MDRLFVSMGGVESPEHPPIGYVFSRLERHMAVVSIFNRLYQESSQVVGEKRLTYPDVLGATGMHRGEIFHLISLCLLIFTRSLTVCCKIIIANYLVCIAIPI